MGAVAGLALTASLGIAGDVAARQCERLGDVIPVIGEAATQAATSDLPLPSASALKPAINEMARRAGVPAELLADALKTLSACEFAPICDTDAHSALARQYVSLESTCESETKADRIIWAARLRGQRTCDDWFAPLLALPVATVIPGTDPKNPDPRVARDFLMSDLLARVAQRLATASAARQSARATRRRAPSY